MQIKCNFGIQQRRRIYQIIGDGPNETAEKPNFVSKLESGI